MIELLCYVFFFKQKTAYEVRISDWSSDVCSSDLPADDPGAAGLAPAGGRAKRHRPSTLANGGEVAMVDLKLGRLPDRTPVKLTIMVPPDLHRALADYVVIYKDRKSVV